jgi:hypothetical protein
VNTATTRDQYSGLNCSGVSTIMKRIGRTGSIVGNIREICRIEADELEVETEESGGIYTPLSRKDLIFDIRRSDDAEGDRRMIGSGRLVVAFGFMAMAGLFARLEATCCCDFLTVKGAAIFRTWEKS